MIKTRLSPIPSGEPWPRPFVRTLVDTALSANSLRFARSLTQAWLDTYPGDLTFQYLLAKIWFARQKLNKSTEILRKVVETDPEFLSAQKLYQKLLRNSKHPSLPLTNGNVYALSGKYKGEIKLPKWSESLIYARRAINQNDYQQAQNLAHEVLALDPPSPLGAITHIRAMLGSPEHPTDTPLSSIRAITEHYHKKWPSCLFFDLVLVDTLMDAGEENQAVALLHYAASRDVGAQVAKSLWGPHHQYLNIWPKKLEAYIDLSIPADVASLLGWNQLSQGQGDETENQPDSQTKAGTPVAVSLDALKTEKSKTKTARTTEPEVLKSVEKQLERVARRIKKPQLAKVDGRFPVYVIFTTKQGLISKYGAETTEAIHRELQKLAAAVRNKEHWGASLVYADDPICMTAFGIKPAKAADPWSLKLAIKELDKKLGEKGSMIGSVLIVGGHDIVPYHMLPNPTDDQDAEIPSDNPYATRDENYFIPEWPIGRIPGGKENDPGLLISTIRKITAYHRQQNKAQEQPLIVWLNWLISLFKGKVRPLRPKHEPFGFSAEAWLKASVSVYRTIGKPEEVVTSPPSELSKEYSLSHFHLGYFNLHGLPDAPEWYGQSDPVINNGDLFYPIAITPSSLENKRNGNGSKNRVPEIIFTEACYGAHFIDKNIEESMALKFLHAGTRTFIGSTATAYGSIDMNLTSADFLAKTFWRLVKEGYPTGEALYRAKIFYAREMHKRNNYLDGEDQKTLISFVHLGDPLYLSPLFHKKHAKLVENQAKKGIFREKKKLSHLNTVCDSCDTWDDNDAIQPQIMAQVKSVVEQYLPTMSGANIAVHQETLPTRNGTSQAGKAKSGEHKPGHSVVVLSKQVRQSKHVHNSFARLTLDGDGKVVKITVSR